MRTEMHLLSRRRLLTTAAAVVASSAVDPARAAQGGAAAAAMTDQQILETLQLAYRWGFPLMAMAINNSDYYGPTRNAFYHMKSAADEKSQNGKGFNAETLYSAGALDLRGEPLVFSMPPTGDRFVVFPVQDAWGNIDNVIGTRTIGNKGGNFLISGPDWKGEVPTGMPHYRLATNIGFLPGRSMVKNPEDAKRFAETVQNDFTLTPLSRWGTGQPNPNRDSIVSPLPVDPARNYHAQLLAMSPNDFFNRLNALLTYNPPYDYDAPVLKRFASTGIGPGMRFDISSFSPAVQDAMAEFARMDPVKTASDFASEGQTQRGREICGRFGTDYLERYRQVFGGLGGNLMEDAMYFWLKADTARRPLDGRQRYVVHFARDQIPQAKAFWSLTIYNNEFYLPRGLPLGRHVLNSNSGMKLSPDGSLDIFLQPDSPGPDREANWLPTPKEGFFGVMRIYWPDNRTLEGKWTQPDVRKVG